MTNGGGLAKCSPCMAVSQRATNWCQIDEGIEEIGAEFSIDAAVDALARAIVTKVGRASYDISCLDTKNTLEKSRA